MRICIDLGNTALKWSCMSDHDNPRTLVHHGNPSYGLELANTFAHLSVSEVVGCSVACKRTMDVCSSVFASRKIPVRWLEPQEKFAGPFTLLNRYVQPLKLGSDRWHAALGAISYLPHKPLLVVHSGTALTVDSIFPLGGDRYEFAGGRIAPGLVLMRDALHWGIPSLPVADSNYNVLPKDTDTAIITGIIDAQLGVVERAMRSMQAAGQEPILVVAGGAATYSIPFLQKEFPDLVQRHNLVLEGLRLRALEM